MHKPCRYAGPAKGAEGGCGPAERPRHSRRSRGRAPLRRIFPLLLAPFLPLGDPHAEPPAVVPEAPGDADVPSRAGPPSDADAGADATQGPASARPALVVPVRPRRRPVDAPPSDAAPAAAAPARPWIAVPLPDGSLAWTRLPKLDERTWWRKDRDFRRAESLLRPDLDFDTRLLLGARAPFARLMGGEWLHLSDARIYERFGRLPDGSQPLDSSRGIYSGMFTAGAESLVTPNILPGAHPPPIDILDH